MKLSSNAEFEIDKQALDSISGSNWIHASVIDAILELVCQVRCDFKPFCFLSSLEHPTGTPSSFSCFQLQRIPCLAPVHQNQECLLHVLSPAVLILSRKSYDKEFLTTSVDSAAPLNKDYLLLPINHGGYKSLLALRDLILLQRPLDSGNHLLSAPFIFQRSRRITRVRYCFRFIDTLSIGHFSFKPKRSKTRHASSSSISKFAFSFPRSKSTSFRPCILILDSLYSDERCDIVSPIIRLDWHSFNFSLTLMIVSFTS